MATAERRADVTWEGDLAGGNGVLKGGSGALDLPVTWASRAERPDGRTSPEELIAAAHASCYAMALSHTLGEDGNAPDRLDVSAVCTLDLDALKVTSSKLTVRGTVPGLEGEGFADAARRAEQICPVSNALRGGLEIELDAALA